MKILAVVLLSSCFITVKECGKEIQIPTPCPSESPSPSSSPKPVPSVSPIPSPSISPIPSPSISPIPSPSSSPIPSPSVSPIPSPSPCVTQKQCMTKDGLPAVNCVRCASYAAEAIANGGWIREGNLVYNELSGGRREYYDPKTCLTVYPNGEVRNRRLYNDGTICGDDCVASPKPCVPSSPKPSPSIPPDGDRWCTLDADGFYPTPPEDFCPPCWRSNPAVLAYWGIALQSKRPCQGVNCGCGVVANVNVTPHSNDNKFLRHRYDFELRVFKGSETHKGCQPSENSLDIPDIWVYPPNDEAGLCDPFSGSRYWCHHKAKAGTCGKTKFEVHEPPFRSIIVDIP